MKIGFGNCDSSGKSRQCYPPAKYPFSQKHTHEVDILEFTVDQLDSLECSFSLLSFATFIWTGGFDVLCCSLFM